jgi:hypothetical protein
MGCSYLTGLRGSLTLLIASFRQQIASASGHPFDHLQLSE